MRLGPEYTRATFAQIERRDGSAQRYLTEVIGLIASKLEAIRQNLVVWRLSHQTA